jgi:hypothetical protein
MAKINIKTEKHITFCEKFYHATELSPHHLRFQVTQKQCAIDVKNPDKKLSGKSDEIEVKIC